MKLIYTLLSVIAGSMLLVSTQAQALTFGYGHYGHYPDGHETRSEVIEHATKQFERLDENSDGKIEVSELSGKKKRRASKVEFMVTRLDDDGDNAISKDEFVAQAVERFDLVDTDNDGKISEEERTEARSILHAHNMQELFEEADTNKDGQLSLEEYSNLGIYAGHPGKKGRWGRKH